MKLILTAKCFRSFSCIAAFCLQSLGLLPTAPQPSSNETLQTVAPEPPQPVPPPVPFGFGPTRRGSQESDNTASHRFTPAHYLQTGY